MSNQIPTWFVQTEDGTLYAYCNKDVLLCDLSIHKDDSIKIFQRYEAGFIEKYEDGFIEKYVPISESDLRGKSV